MPTLVTFHYTLRDPQGQLIDSSQGGGPLSYVDGAGQIIDGLEEALRGLPVGTKTTVQVEAARGYGERDAEMVQRIPRSAMPIEGELKIGDRFRTGADPYAPIVMVTAIEDDEVELDANHPLAGVDLSFEVEIMGVREMTEEQLKTMQEGDGCCGGNGGGGCGCH